jgi:DNA-binding Xre family transcriptional regulator
MSTRQTTKRSTGDRRREMALRKRFQEEKPTLDELLASGDYDGPVEAADAWPVDRVLSHFKRLREQAGLTQQELAKKIGMDTTALSRLESGRQANVTMQTLERIARGLGYDLQVQVRPSRAPKAA